MENEKFEGFPLSVTKEITGTRRLAREKILQILFAQYISGSPVDDLFRYIVHRNFNFGDNVTEIKEKRLLKPSEVREIEADIPIKWKDDDLEFILNLIKKSIKNKDYIDELIHKYASHWEIDRIALLDRLIMHVAVTELIDFELIPPKVTLNEAIEIAKSFSTDKSNLFINALLDKIVIQLRKEGKIIKKGKGLIEK